MGNTAEPTTLPASTAELAGASGNAASAASATKPAGSTPRRFNRHLRPELVEQMVSSHRTGLSVKQIAQQFGFHRETVAIHLKRAGLTLRTNVTDRTFRQRVYQTYEAAGTVKETAKQLGVSRDTVRKVLRE